MKKIEMVSHRRNKDPKQSLFKWRVKMKRKLVLAVLLSTVMATSGVIPAMGADANEKTAGLQNAAETQQESDSEAQDENEKMGTWTDAGKIILTPGENETAMNFAWYSENLQKPRVRISTDSQMADAVTYSGNAREIDKTTYTDKEDGYDYHASNKVGTGTGALNANTTYYYEYSTDGTNWSDIYSFRTGDPAGFSAVYVGDPQIGASGNHDGDAEDPDITNDVAGWSKTLSEAEMVDPNASFVLSVGDQINHASGNSAQDYVDRELEYAGFLSPDILRSLPVSTAIGNHESMGNDYKYHYNNPNSSDNLGETNSGCDYYYSYGNVLFIVLNSNSRNVAEHEKLMQKAIDSKKDAKWRVVMFHHDIYGSAAPHSDVDAANLRTLFAPLMDEFNIDVCLTGHDHSYCRTYQIIDGKAVDYGQDSATDPEGTLYMTAGSASGSKFYALNKIKQYYVAERNGQKTPSFSIVNFTDDTFKIQTYTNNGEKYAGDFTITKTRAKRKNLKQLTEEADQIDTSKYTKASSDKLKEASETAKKTLGTDEDSVPSELSEKYDKTFWQSNNPDDPLNYYAYAQGDYAESSSNTKLKAGYNAFLDKTMNNDQGQIKSADYEKIYQAVADAQEGLIRQGSGSHSGGGTIPTPSVTPKPSNPSNPSAPQQNEEKTEMYRVYNPNSGEHFYTGSEVEKNVLVKLGWRYEGIGWYAPKKSTVPVYRLYNPNAGDHHYTANAGEKNALVKLGWRDEGIGWYSADSTTGVPVYRQYNPNAKTGTHNYTASRGESDLLVKLGWKYEGIAWYGLKK